MWKRRLRKKGNASLCWSKGLAVIIHFGSASFERITRALTCVCAFTLMRGIRTLERDFASLEQIRHRSEKRYSLTSRLDEYGQGLKSV